MRFFLQAIQNSLGHFKVQMLSSSSKVPVELKLVGKQPLCSHMMTLSLPTSFCHGERIQEWKQSLTGPRLDGIPLTESIARRDV